jgi:hypothetical protein
MPNLSEEEFRQFHRAEAWERAKAALQTILHTYYPEYYSNGNPKDNGYDDMEAAIKRFIPEMDGLL